MKLGALFGWGVVIYSTLYLVWSGLSLYGVAGTPLSRIVVLLTLVGVASLATRSLRLSSEHDGIPYAIGWVTIAALLDAIFAVPLAGWGIYTDWNLWVGYVLLFIVPFVVIAVSKKHTASLD